MSEPRPSTALGMIWVARVGWPISLLWDLPDVETSFFDCARYDMGGPDFSPGFKAPNYIVDNRVYNRILTP